MHWAEHMDFFYCLYISLVENQGNKLSQIGRCTLGVRDCAWPLTSSSECGGERPDCSQRRELNTSTLTGNPSIVTTRLKTCLNIAGIQHRFISFLPSSFLCPNSYQIRTVDQQKIRRILLICTSVNLCGLWETEKWGDISRTVPFIHCQVELSPRGLVEDTSVACREERVSAG